MSQTPETDRVVVKVGGSLFTRPDLARELEKAARRLDDLAGASLRVWIAGGGAAVDALRAIDTANPLPTTVTHRTAIRLMDANARLLCEWLPGAEGTSDWETIQKAEGGDWVFAPGRFLDAIEPGLPGTRLPTGWSVTSDSIAARVAEGLGACLVLFKSRAPTPGEEAEGWIEAAARGYVDDYFPRAVQGLRRVIAEEIGSAVEVGGSPGSPDSGISPRK